MSFSSLRLNRWKQFSNVSLTIHRNVTIVTGANGAGKTTILNIFARHFGWDHQEVATPTKDAKSGIISYLFSLWKGMKSESGRIQIGTLEYTNGVNAKITIPENGTAVYQPEINGQQHVAGLSIPSHRPYFGYAQVPHVGTSKRTKINAFDVFVGNSRQRHLGGGGHPVNFHLKETLIGWAVFGGGNTFIEGDSEQAENFKGFEEVLRKMLPESIGFSSLAIRGQNDVVLLTKTGDFVVDAVSGGLSAIIDLSWQIYLKTEKATSTTVIIDEVENHLHASMQRVLLPSLIKAFPETQFIVSTHSPLIVGSVKDSFVYALRYDDENKVYSTKLDINEKSQAASEILREVLGVPFTMPIWVEEKIDEIVARYSKRKADPSALREFRSELNQSGLSHLTSEALMRLSESRL